MNVRFHTPTRWRAKSIHVRAPAARISDSVALLVTGRNASPSQACSAYSVGEYRSNTFTGWTYTVSRLR